MSEAWLRLREGLESGANGVQVLPSQRDDGPAVLAALGVPPDTALGALALHAGGVLVDGGWLRILGSGHPRLPGSLADWNGLGQDARPAWVRGALVVGHDLVGGVYAVNAGGLPGDTGEVNWFSPAERVWVGLGLGYAAWLEWAADGDLAGLYNPLRWRDWEEDAEVLGGHQGVHLWPPPGAGGDPDEATRTVLSMEELVQAVFTGAPPQPGVAN